MTLVEEAKAAPEIASALKSMGRHDWADNVEHLGNFVMEALTGLDTLTATGKKMAIELDLLQGNIKDLRKAWEDVRG